VPDYRVLGGSLRSVLDFPGLRTTSTSEPTWQLQVIDEAAPTLPSESLGSDSVRGKFLVQASRTKEGYRLVYSDTGTFDILLGGALVHWYRPPASSWPWSQDQFYEAVRIDVLGRVLAAALHLQGILCLHASAVRIGERAIALLAPKFHGKSTLAYAMVRAGAQLITDDTLPVEPGPPVRARPGVHNVRMWGDSADRLDAESEGFSRGSFGKFQASRLPDDLLVYEPTDLAALYLLLPLQGQADDPVVRREPLDPVSAALALVEHGRLGALLGKQEAVRLLHWAGDISSLVPVQVLGVVRDWDRLPELAEAIIRLHRDP
jgi:hypothetical protein